MAKVEPPRIKAFRLGLAKAIPKFPNDRNSLHALQNKSLGGILIDYANWAIRYVAQRPRTVIVEKEASSDRRWKKQRVAIQAFLKKVEQGDDLTPHLSLQPHTRGYTPAASKVGPDADRWADKDFLLNVMGYHHFHLDAAPHNQMRSDDVIFAQVTRDTFYAVGVFNHTVFVPTAPTGKGCAIRAFLSRIGITWRSSGMTAERARLWRIFDNRSTGAAGRGSVMMTSMIATSGHSLHFISMATDYARAITTFDPNLDDPNYVSGLYQQAGVPLPKKPKLRWHINALDLGLFDKATSAFFVLRKGPT